MRIHRADQRSLGRRGPLVHLGLVCLAIGALLIGGCTSVASSTGAAVKLVGTQRRVQPPTAAEVAANPYYQMYAVTPAGQAVLILGNLDGNREAWYGQGGVVIFVLDGQIVQTAGLKQNLEGLREAVDNPFARGLQHLTSALTYRRSEDWSGYRYGVPVQARIEPVGVTHVTILGVSHTVLQIHETLDAPVAHYHAVNQYWVDTRDGLIWKSTQQIAPGERVTLTQLKPYPGARR